MARKKYFVDLKKVLRSKYQSAPYSISDLKKYSNEELQNELYRLRKIYRNRYFAFKKWQSSTNSPISTAFAELETDTPYGRENAWVTNNDPTYGIGKDWDRITLINKTLQAINLIDNKTSLISGWVSTKNKLENAVKLGIKEKLKIDKDVDFTALFSNKDYSDIFWEIYNKIKESPEDIINDYTSPSVVMETINVYMQENNVTESGADVVDAIIDILKNKKTELYKKEQRKRRQALQEIEDVDPFEPHFRD